MSVAPKARKVRWGPACGGRYLERGEDQDASKARPVVRLDVWQGHIAKVGQLRVNGCGADKPGRLQLAHGGPLFLEEVADLPLDYQGRLRDALRDQQVTRVGEDRQRGFNARMNASTSCDLSRAVETVTARALILSSGDTLQTEGREVSLPTPRHPRGRS